jgi:hypothetical protein
MAEGLTSAEALIVVPLHILAQLKQIVSAIGDGSGAAA